MFDILTSMDVIDGAPIVDLFAGSGALGIEALSRGAASVTFVDHDRAAAEAIRANLALLGDAAHRGRVVQADAIGWVERASPDAPAGVVLADPPYTWDRWGALLDPLAAVADLLVAETNGPLPCGPGWETVRSRRYGRTVVTVLRPDSTAGTSQAAGSIHNEQRRGGT